MRRTDLGTALVLLIGPLIWGIGFVATKATLSGSGPLWANAIRFGLGSLVLLPFSWRGLASLTRKQLGAGLLLGVFLFAAFTGQTAGLVTTSVAHSSFITGLYAVLVPLIGPFFGKRPHPVQLLAAGLAVLGLLLLTGLGSLTLGFGAGESFSIGDLLTFGCALVSAVHILIADRVAHDASPLVLNWLQLATVFLLSSLVALPIEGFPAVHWTAGVIAGQLYLAIFSSGVAFTLQFWGQRRISPAAAAMIFLLEAPFGALAGAVVYGERMGWLQACGGLLILIASFLSVWSQPLTAESETLREARP